MCGHCCSMPLLDQVPASLIPCLDSKVRAFLVCAHVLSHFPPKTLHSRQCVEHVNRLVSASPVVSSLWENTGPFCASSLGQGHHRPLRSLPCLQTFCQGLEAQPIPNPRHFGKLVLLPLQDSAYQEFSNGRNLP